eukprot:scaffold49319_cov88-Phaeocystis_antarctica.AAC.2
MTSTMCKRHRISTPVRATGRPMPIVVRGALTMESIACFVASSQSLVSKSHTLEHLCTNVMALCGR